MRSRKLGKDWKDVGGPYGEAILEQAPKIGALAYYGFVVAVAGSLIWFASVISSANSFADVRPTLHTALGSFAAFFSGGEPVMNVLAIEAPGQVIALNALEVKSAVSARVVTALKQDAVVEEGDVIARLDDADARAAVKSAEASLAAAEHELAAASVSAAPSTAGSASPSATAIDQAYTALSNAHVNLAWIVPTLTDVLEGKEVKSSVGNMYAYAEFISSAYPEIGAEREKVADDMRRARNSYALVLEKYRGITRESSQAETQAVMAETYDSLKLTADALKSAGDYLSVIHEKFDETEQPQLETMATHRGALSDALVSTNDSLDELSYAIEALRGGQAPVVIEAPDLNGLQVAVREQQAYVEAAKAHLDDYVVRAPLSGKLTSVVRADQSVVQGEILATIMTEELAARVSFSEADIGYVRVGEAVNVTFDGVEGHALPGTVLALDSVATVENGSVRFYGIVGFENSGRIRPGMTVTVKMVK